MDPRTRSERVEESGIDLSKDPRMDRLAGIFARLTPDRQDAMMDVLQSEDSDNGKKEEREDGSCQSP